MRILKILYILTIIAGTACLLSAFLALISGLFLIFVVCLSVGIVLLSASIVFYRIRQSLLEGKNVNQKLDHNMNDVSFPPSKAEPVPGYKPEKFDVAFSAADFDEIAKIKVIYDGSSIINCSLVDKQTSSVTLMMDQTEYVYRLIEMLTANDGLWSFIQSITVNDTPYYLYFREVPSKESTWGYDIFYTESDIVYESMKLGQNPNSNFCSPYLKNLGKVFASNHTASIRIIPYIIAALTRQKKISSTREGLFLC